jgi:hypothetical protein
LEFVEGETIALYPLYPLHKLAAGEPSALSPLPELVEGEPRAPLLRLLLRLFAERLRQAELVLLLQAGAALPGPYFTNCMYILKI